jgi:hypothetical protein
MGTSCILVSLTRIPSYPYDGLEQRMIVLSKIGSR